MAMVLCQFIGSCRGLLVCFMELSDPYLISALPVLGSGSLTLIGAYFVIEQSELYRNGVCSVIQMPSSMLV